MPFVDFLLQKFLFKKTLIYTLILLVFNKSSFLFRSKINTRCCMGHGLHIAETSHAVIIIDLKNQAFINIFLYPVTFLISKDETQTSLMIDYCHYSNHRSHLSQCQNILDAC